MLYAVSKVAGFLILPSTLSVLLIMAGVGGLALGMARQLALRLAAGGAALLVVCGFSPLGNWLIWPLEQRFAQPSVAELGRAVDGIIILGGFEDGRVSAGRGGLMVNEAAERLTEGVRLARRHPSARVVFTGGAAGLLLAQSTAAGPVGAFFLDMGVSADRIVLESASRNTWENAVLTLALIAPEPGERWLLVTSASHMPRAIGIFRKAGLDAIPYPVDYRTRDAGDLARPFEDLPNGLERVDRAVKEWAGLAGYWLLGRTSALFPAP